MKFLLLMLLFKYSYESICKEEEPFILKDRGCGSFNEACLIKDNEVCNQLQQACKQCPPSNYTILMLIDIKNGYKTILNYLNSSHKVQKEDIGSIKGNRFAVLTLCFLVVLIILDIILHVEQRSKFIHRLKCSFLKSRKYEMIRNSKYGINKQSLNARFESGIERLNTTEITRREIKFKVEGTCVVLLISPDDNVVMIKRLICAKLIFSEPSDFKRMEIQFNGRCIDDNDRLWRHFSNNESELICNINQSKNPSAIIILRLIGINVQRLIQIDEDKSLKDLKEIIIASNNSDNKIFIPKSSNKIDLIDDFDIDQTIKDCNIKDNDCIRVIVEKQGYFKLESISKNVSISKIKYSNIKRISTLKDQIGEELNCNSDNIFLFERNICLNDKKYIFEYQFLDGQILHYYQFDEYKDEDFEIIQEYKNNDEYNISQTKYSKNNIIYMIKRYSSQPLSENLINEMITFKLTKDFENIMKLKISLKSVQFYYIGVKYEKSLEQLLNESTESIDEYKIVKWTRDILNGLSEFHESNISHPYLKTSKIIICKNSAKISLFCSIENNPNYDNRGTFGQSGNRNEDKCKEFDDIKKLGQILLAIINSKCYLRENNEDVERGPLLGNDNYKDRKDISKELKEFLNACLNNNINQINAVKQLSALKFLK